MALIYSSQSPHNDCRQLCWPNKKWPDRRPITDCYKMQDKRRSNYIVQIRKFCVKWIAVWSGQITICEVFVQRLTVASRLHRGHRKFSILTKLKLTIYNLFRCGFALQILEYNHQNGHFRHDITITCYDYLVTVQTYQTYLAAVENEIEYILGVKIHSWGLVLGIILTPKPNSSKQEKY